LTQIRFAVVGFLLISFLVFPACGPPSSEHASNEGPSSLPNIIFILADDLGYGDIGIYNPDSKIPTPHLDHMATDGMRFTDAHSGSGVCTPTRYGVLTGRYSWRTWLKQGVLWPPDDKPLIDSGRLTVAGLLRQTGYTTACIGKWHLGIEWGRNDQGEVDFNRPLKYGPTDVGFDEFFGIAGSLDMIPYVFYRNREATVEVSDKQAALPFPRFIREGPRGNGFDAGKALDELTEQAISFINSHARKSHPFFLYFALTAPHKPVWPAERFVGRTVLGPYGDFVHQVDGTVGQVLEALDKNGIKDNTLIFFTSDNGSYMYSLPPDEPDHTDDPGIQGFHADTHQSSGGWRGTKADIWEGGHRVPFIVRWPGKIEPGSLCDRTICLTDLMATCAEIVGVVLPESAAEDSFSLLPLLRGEGWKIPRAPVIHHSSNGTFALREGKWKMVFGSGSGGREKPVGKPFEKPYLLFDLGEDPRESADLIDQFPEIAAELTESLRSIRENGKSRRP
jgi:arylsulfatase A-like enzyme